MSIYISKNNQQMGPFDEAKVLEMLAGGQLSPNDYAIRQGGSQWQKLSDLFPSAARPVNVPPVAQPPFQQQSAQAFNQPAAAQTSAAAPAKKSRKGILIGCLGVLLLSGLVLAVLGFFAYRNLNPADSRENLPDQVKDYKLGERYPPKGNIWGSEATFMGIYKNSSDSIIYLMTEYSSESAAKEAMRTELAKSCKAGESPMYFSFTKNGAEVSEGATCAIPLFVQKDNKLVALGGSGAGASAFIEFAENLPFNAGAEMKKK